MMKEIPKVQINEKERGKTYSTIFLLPALKLDRAMLTKHGFVNCYIGDAAHDVEYENALFVLLEPKLGTEFNTFLRSQYDSTMYLEDYDVGGGQVMVVYKFPYPKEMEHFKKGEYSKFDKDYVNKFFPKTSSKSKRSSVFSGIFNKEKWLKEYWEQRLDVDNLPNEYWSIPNTQKEVFRS